MKLMARTAIGLVAAIAASALVWQVVAGDNGGKSKEETVKLEDCPAAVQKAIQDNAGGGRIVEVEKEIQKDGTVVYEADVKTAEGKEFDIKVAADGTLLKVEDDGEGEDEAKENEKEDDN